MFFHHFSPSNEHLSHLVVAWLVHMKDGKAEEMGGLICPFIVELQICSICEKKKPHALGNFESLQLSIAPVIWSCLQFDLQEVCTIQPFSTPPPPIKKQRCAVAGILTS